MSGCSATGPEGDPDALSVHNKNLTLAIGDTTTLAVTLGSNVPPVSTSSAGYGGNLETEKRIEFRTKDATVATIDERGKIKALGPGVTYVSARINESSDSTRLAVISNSQPSPRFKEVGAGSSHACGLAISSAIYCWGSNWLGELGQGNTHKFQITASPTQISAREIFVSLTVGYFHNCALTAQGSAYCWGDNAYGQLGRTSPDRSGVPAKVEDVPPLVSVSAGADRTCGLTSARSIVCWGRGYSQGTEFAASDDDGFVSVSVGSEHICAVTNAARVRCWGNNRFGELGDGTQLAAAAPKPILSGERFLSVSAGSNYTCAVSATADIWCWGRGYNGRLGIGSQLESSVPARVVGSLKYLSVETGTDHTCAIARSGEPYCWGSDSREALGNGANDANQTQFVVAIPSRVSSNDSFVGIAAASGDFSCAVTANQTALCWGSNLVGTLGIGHISRNNSSVNTQPNPIVVARFLHN
ncbi:MAG: RCC1 domain-containing protein [Gemmatimonas sp.]